MIEHVALQIPTVTFPKPVFIALNYLIVGLFVVLNSYITYQIVKAYGPMLLSLFTGEGV